MDRRLITILLGAVMVFSLFGCGNKAVLGKGKFSEQDIVPVMESRLNQKYGEDFKVSSVEKGDDGVDFSKSYYLADAVCSSNGVAFKLRIETDGSGISDNYEGYLYKSEIEKEIADLFSEARGLQSSGLTVEFLFSDSASKTIDKYKKTGNAVVQTSIKVDAGTAADAADAAFDLINALQDDGYGYSLDFEWNGEHVILYRDGLYEKVTKELIRRKFGV